MICPLRKLASIRRVSELVPIPNADRIELAKIDGWQCVCGKGDFQVGDLGVYFEIDSYLPIEERYEFLRKSSYKKLTDGTEGFRLRSMNFRGVLSQGLLLPLSKFPELDGRADLQPGLDLTDLLKVKLFEEPSTLTIEKKGPFPSFIRKTDQERIQNLPEYFDLYKDLEFEATEKVDGTSTSIFYNNGEFGICSRNFEIAKNTQTVQWALCEKLKLEDVLRTLGRNLALQCELIGNKVQGNPYQLKHQKFMLFDIYDIDTKRYLGHEERVKFFDSILQSVENNDNNNLLDHVPIVEKHFKVFQKYRTIEEILSASDGKSAVTPAIWREGLVYKAMDASVSFKVVSNKYLLQNTK